MNNCGWIGLDIKPRRKVSRWSRNRYSSRHFKWLVPMILLLLSLGIIVFAGTR